MTCRSWLQIGVDRQHRNQAADSHPDIAQRRACRTTARARSLALPGNASERPRTCLFGFAEFLENRLEPMTSSFDARLFENDSFRLKALWVAGRQRRRPSGGPVCLRRGVTKLLARRRPGSPFLDQERSFAGILPNHL